MNIERGNFEQMEDSEEGEEKRVTGDDIMTFEVFAEKYPDHMPPSRDAQYTVEGVGEYEGKSIRYFGSRHNNDPHDPKISEGGTRPEDEPNMFDEIRDQFQEFLQTHSPEKGKVFIEGMRGLQENEEKEIDRIRSMSYEEVIREYGESGFTAKLAIESGVDVESSEPDPSELIEYLRNQGFSKEEIFAFDFHMMIPQYHRRGGELTPGAFQNFIEPYIEGFQNDTNWEDFDYSMEHASRIGEKIWGSPLNLEDKKFYESRTDPVLSEEHRDEQGRINEVAQQFNTFRDVHMVNRMPEVLQDKDAIFVVAGDSHAVKQKKAIEKIHPEQRLF